jgi:hypothetical protein
MRQIVAAWGLVSHGDSPPPEELIESVGNILSHRSGKFHGSVPCICASGCVVHPEMLLDKVPIRR